VNLANLSRKILKEFVRDFTPPSPPAGGFGGQGTSAVYFLDFTKAHILCSGVLFS
jgi:hypothetical protein